MRNSAKLGLTALLAALLLASTIGAASARNLEVSNQRFRVTWSRLEWQSSVATLRCQLTLEGSFHERTIPKTARTLIGHITRVDIHRPSCTGGELEIHNETLPWHITYEGFTGTLPNITSVILLLREFLVGFTTVILGFRVTCTYGTATDNLSYSAALNAERAIINLVPRAGSNIVHFLAGGGTCPSTTTLVGGAADGRVTLLNTTTLITVRLI